jgi:hypothetical protein
MTKKDTVLYSRFMLRQEMIEQIINHNLVICRFPPHYTEDDMACFLFDLKHFPIDRIIQQFTKIGGIILYQK